MAIEDQKLDDEIDLAELLSALWAQKILVISSSGLGIMLAAFFAIFVATPSYNASATFELTEASPGSFGELGGLASLAGIDINRGGSNESEKLEDRIFSRPFLQQIAESAELYKDPHFNAYISPPGLKQRVFEAVGLSSGELPTHAEIEMSLAKSFETSVSLEVKKNGVVQVTLNHPDPERAATIANVIVDQVLQNVDEMRREQDNERLEYFSAQLLEVQSKLDQSNQALKDYSLANNLRSREELARSSAQLVLLRERRKNLRDRINALNGLEEIRSNTDGFDDQLRSLFLTRYPVASSLEFRRLLGWSGAEGAWTIPDEPELKRLSQDLDTEYSSLERAFRELEDDARRTAEAATELELLGREVALNQVMYEAILKQFESDSLILGLSVEGGRVIDPAIPPIEPSAPRKALMAALGLVLGAMVGIGSALIIASRRGTLYSKSAIKEAFALPHTKTAHPEFARHRLRNLDRMKKMLRGKPMRGLEDLLTQLMPNDLDRVVLVPSAMSNLAINGALAICDTIRPESGSVCLVDLTGDGELAKRLDKVIGEEALELSNGFFVVRPHLGNGGFRNSRLELVVDALSVDHERVVLFCPPPEQGTAMTQKAVNLASCVVVFAQRGYATRDASEDITSLLSVKSAIPAGLLIA